MRTLLVAPAVVLVFSILCEAQTDRLPLPKIKQEAASALRILTQTDHPEDLASMGFKAPAEAREAKVNEPLPVFMVRLDELSQYRPGDDPSKLLRPCNQVLYTVVVGERLESSVSVENNDGKWVATSVGSPELIKMLDKVRKDNARSRGLPSTSFFAVNIPALNLYFIGHHDRGLMLAPISDDPDYGFKASVIMTGEGVFSALAGPARQHDGLPR